MLNAFMNDLTGTGAVISGIAATIAAVYSRKTRKEMQPDHGNSMRDLMNAMRDLMNAMRDLIYSQGHQIGEIHEEMLDIRAEMRDIREIRGRGLFGRF